MGNDREKLAKEIDKKPPNPNERQGKKTKRLFN